MKQKTVFVVLLVAGVFLGLTLTGGLFAKDSGPTEQDIDHVPEGVVFQDAEAAWDADVAILAEESGFPVTQVERAMAAQQEFGAYADELLNRYPDLIANVWMEPLPGTRGHVQFTGEVPADVARGLDKNGQNDIAVVTGKGMVSLNDQYRRAELVADTLLSLGYDNSLVFFDQMNEVIQVEVKLPENEKQPTIVELITTLREMAQSTGLQGQAARFAINDVDLTVIRGEGPIVELTHSRGGEWLRDDGWRECTSGWSVSGPYGDGIMTAAHCNGLNQFEQSGCCVYGMTWRRQEFGQGDTEYHTTTHIEPDDFYASATQIRDVSGTRPTWAMVGYYVCSYGRSSNTRTCNHVVEAINVTVNYSIGTVHRLARASNNQLIPGDSGGGWSWGNVAWGVTSGGGGGKSYFTPVRVGESELGVTVKR